MFVQYLSEKLWGWAGAGFVISPLNVVHVAFVAMATRKVLFKKNVDLKSVQGKVLKSAIGITKNAGGVIMPRLIGSV